MTWSMLTFAQKVADYKYVIIPENFSTFKENFGLSKFLEKSLKGKKYVTLPVSKDEWPAEAKDNSCNVLKVDVIDDSGFLRNKVILQFKDCNDKVLQQAKGSSNIKDYEQGFQDALKQSLIAVPVSYPTAMLAKTQVETPVNEPVKPVAVVESTPSSSENKMATKYNNGKLNLQKVQIDNSQFILVRSDSSVPYATFKESTKKDVFRVKLENGESTIGYFENGSIIIEVPTANGGFSKEVFLGK